MKLKHHSHFRHKLVCRSSLFFLGLTKASSDEQKENRSLNSLEAALVASRDSSGESAFSFYVHKVKVSLF